MSQGTRHLCKHFWPPGLSKAHIFLLQKAAKQTEAKQHGDNKWMPEMRTTNTAGADTLPPGSLSSASTFFSTASTRIHNGHSAQPGSVHIPDSTLKLPGACAMRLCTGHPY